MKEKKILIIVAVVCVGIILAVIFCLPILLPTPETSSDEEVTATYTTEENGSIELPTQPIEEYVVDNNYVGEFSEEKLPEHTYCTLYTGAIDYYEDWLMANHVGDEEYVNRVMQLYYTFERNIEPIRNFSETEATYRYNFNDREVYHLIVNDEPYCFVVDEYGSGVYIFKE